MLSTSPVDLSHMCELLWFKAMSETRVTATSTAFSMDQLTEWGSEISQQLEQNREITFEFTTEGFLSFFPVPVFGGPQDRIEQLGDQGILPSGLVFQRR